MQASIFSFYFAVNCLIQWFDRRKCQRQKCRRCLNFYLALRQMWLGGVVVAASDMQLRGHRFDSQPIHHPVTTLGKLFTHVPLSPSSIIWYQPTRWEGNSSIWERCGITGLCLQLTAGSGPCERRELCAERAAMSCERAMLTMGNFTLPCDKLVIVASSAVSMTGW